MIDLLMKKLLFSFFALGSFISISQTVHKCYSKEAIDYQQSMMPDYVQRVNDQFEKAKLWSLNHSPKRNLYTIPVVFHIVYNTSEGNISDEILQNQIEILNQDYARLNPDTINTRSEFQSLVAPTNVRFVLADIDPQGNPTSGITRTQTSVETFAGNDLSFENLEKVKATTAGGMDPWNPDEYLNIWVCNMAIDFFGAPLALLLGYATPPDGLSNWPSNTGTEDLIDGVVLQYQVVGDVEHNPNTVLPDSKGRTAVHEIGHYLGLRHIWGDGDCTMDDGVDDTPDATDASSQDCMFNKNTCNADVVGLGDLNDMVENYMDYSSELCQNSFTFQQTAIMHGVLENERFNLVNSPSSALLNENSRSDFEVFPNPTSEILKLSSDNLMSKVSILDLNGRNLKTTTLNNMNLVTFDLNKIENGVYIVNVEFKNGQTTQKRVTKN